MNWLLEFTAYIIAALVMIIVNIVLTNVLKIETIGSTEAKVVQDIVKMLLNWGLLLLLLELNGVTITWPG